MPRVLYLANRRPDAHGRLPWLGKAPRHQAFGAHSFAERGYLLTTPSAAEHRVLMALVSRLNRFGGQSDVLAAQQVLALRAHRRSDLVYTPWDLRGAGFLAQFRAAGLVRTPLVALMHSPPRSRRSVLSRPLWHGFLRGCEALPCLSSTITQALETDGAARGKAVTLALGPDAEWYVPSDTVGERALCIGKSLRDFDTFGVAATRAAVPARIVCTPDNVTPAFSSFGDNVEVKTGDRGPVPWGPVCEMYRTARVVAICLSSTRILAGLWVLLDALGFGRPVIMTRSPLIDLDIEAEGIGRWVDMGDVDGWCDALRFFEDHPDEAREMGRRARRLVDQGYDIRHFAHRLMDVFDSLLGIDTRADDDREGQT